MAAASCLRHSAWLLLLLGAFYTADALSFDSKGGHLQNNHHKGRHKHRRHAPEVHRQAARSDAKHAKATASAKEARGHGSGAGAKHGKEAEAMEPAARLTAGARSAIGEEGPAEGYWPHGRGRVGSFGTSEIRGPRNLSQAPTWSWHHPDGKYHTTVVGSPLIDGDMNIYLATEDAVRKFDQMGILLWTYAAPGPIGTCPSLFQGSVYGSTQTGRLFAVDMQSGHSKWVVNASRSVGGGAGFVEAHDSVVIAAVDSQGDGGNSRVVCLSSDSGKLLWDFEPDTSVYNFAPVFGPNRTVLFQDGSSGLYCMGLDHGKVLWRKAGQELMGGEEDDGSNVGSTQPSHTDGGVALGPDGVVFSVGVWATSRGTRQDTPGAVSAYRIADGRLLWYKQTLRAPNTVPTVARLAKDKKAPLSVVVPMGKPPALPVIEYMPWWVPKAWRLAFHKQSVALGDNANKLWHNRRVQTELVTLDAKTGEVGWSYEAPTWARVAGAGDDEGYLERERLGIRDTCQPPPWSTPTVDVDGTMYVGHESGKFMAIRDKNHDGHINKKHEVSVFDAGAGFLQPAALAPGMLAVASCDGLFVFVDGELADAA